jgi:DNA-binding transcriptional ArsR family regulator
MTEPLLDQVYAAIADPTRRAILAALATGDLNVGALAARFPISLNGVSKHVQVLERAGLVERTVRGREHRLRLNAAPLRDATQWLEHYRAFWAGTSVWPRSRRSSCSTAASERESSRVAHRGATGDHVRSTRYGRPGRRAACHTRTA